MIKLPLSDQFVEALPQICQRIRSRPGFNVVEQHPMTGESGDLTRTKVTLKLIEGESFQNPLRVISFDVFTDVHTIPSTAANKLSVGQSATHRSIERNIVVQREEAKRFESTRTDLLDSTADLLGRSVAAGETGPGTAVRVADGRNTITYQQYLVASSSKRSLAAEIAVHRRMAQAFSALAFVLLGMAVGLRYGAGGSMKAGLVALVILVLAYYIPLLAMRSAARAGWHPTIIWIPTVFLALIGTVSLRRTFERT